MDFVEKVVEKFTSGGSGGYGGQPPTQGDGPSVPPPWVALWDEREQRYYYVNEQTGERSWTPPPAPGGYGERYAEEPQQQSSNHNFGYGMAGAAAGLVGGALLMHEGEKIRMCPRTRIFLVLPFIPSLMLAISLR